MDGLVSTGNEFPFTILEINFSLTKNISNYFINILIGLVEKQREIMDISHNTFCENENENEINYDYSFDTTLYSSMFQGFLFFNFFIK
jgi:hypothetical protein